jgi:peptidoglycan/xylan/chitin deacetylase (PgdA/CDA1 family)
MKKALLRFLDPTRATLLMALAIGLGVAVHEGFFFVALLIALGTSIDWAVRATLRQQHIVHLKADASASVKATGVIDGKRPLRDQISAAAAFTLKCIAVVATLAFFLLLVGSSFLYGTLVTPDNRSRLAASETAGPFGEIIRGRRGKSEIALTFDAGAEAECFEDLIAALASAHANSTFFITGRFTHEHADCAAEITKHGHEIGNHTWSHLNLTEQSDEVVRDEITRTERAIVQIAGQTPRPRFRAPYGIRDERVLKTASNLGYRSIYWTLDSLDGVEPAKTPQFLIDRITSKSDAELDGAIILMHVGVRSTADALPAIISNLQGRGFHLVTISKLLEPAPKRQ